MTAEKKSAHSQLRHLFQPKHIAVVGASRTPGKLGHTVVHNLVRTGFPGRVSPINATGADVDGLKGYRSLSDLPEQADLAFLVVPATAVIEALQQCRDAGVRVAIIGASGFAELGSAEGISRQHHIASIARMSGIRLLGPNTNGVFSGADHLSLGYNAAHGNSIELGTVAIASHSGALFDGVARRLRNFGAGLSKFVPVGNEADLTMLDFLDYFIDDPSTSVIGLIVEGLTDGDRFRTLAGRARERGKPIVALKLGRSAAGAGATLAHSSRLAGNARAYDALFRESGVARVPSVEALAGGCAMLAGLESGLKLEDLRLVCVTTSGAGGALLADVAAERGLELAGIDGELPKDAGQKIARQPTSAPIRHPIDMGSVGDWALLSPIDEALTVAGLVGPTVAYAHNAPAPGMDLQLADALIQRKRQCKSPVLVLAPGGLGEGTEALYRTNGVPVFHDTAACFDSLDCVRILKFSPGKELPTSVAADPEQTRLLGEAAAGGFLSELESARLLRSAGLPMVDSVRVNSFGEARAAAGRFGFPVVLKALAPGIAHKNHYGLVAVGIQDEEQLTARYAHLERRIAELGHDTATVPILLQPMLSSNAELILGVSREASLGHFVVVGLGGIHTELFDEVVLFPVPIAADVVEDRLRASRVGRFLERIAGHAIPFGLIEAIQALQQLVLSHGALIASIDINPLLIRDDRCVAVDALVVPAKT